VIFGSTVCIEQTSSMTSSGANDSPSAGNGDSASGDVLNVGG